MPQATFARALAAAVVVFLLRDVTGNVALAQVEEVVVTARKRAENLQDIPMVVSTISSAAIERKGINDLADIAKYSSGVILDEGFNKQDTRVVIRGLSPTRGRQNVAILQDEVDISSLAQATAGGSFVINPRLMDLERIEIVKGPHSALYGRSAFNGAIDYVTRKPGNTFVSNLQADLANYDSQQLRYSVSGPVSEKVALGFIAAGWHAGGFYDSPTTGKGLGGGRGGGAALSLNATPADRFVITARSEFSRDDFDPEASSIKNPTNIPLPDIVFQTINGLPPVVGAAVAANPANRTFPQTVGSLGTAADFPAPSPSRNPRTGKDYPGSTRHIWRTTLRLEAGLGPTTLTSISHYGDNRTFQFNDALAVGDLQNPLISGGQETYFDTTIKLLSQELRLQGPSENRFVWTLGGLYWKEKLTQIDKALRCASTGGGCWAVFAAAADVARTPSDNLTHRDTEHKSVYGLAEFKFTERFKGSVELRYTDEEEKTDGYAVISPVTLGCPNVAGVGRVLVNGVFACVQPGAQVTGPFTAATFVSENNPVGGVVPVVDSRYTTPRYALDYKLTNDALVYVSAAQGKKPGGVSALNGIQSLASNIYAPESIWSYELGWKTSWLDRRLTLNGAVYYEDYSQKQVSITFVDPNSLPTPNQLATRVVNAARADVKGFEFDLNAAPTNNLSLNLSYTFNDGKYDSFTDVQSGVSAISRAVVNNPNACTVVQVLVGTALQNRCAISYAGNTLEGAPRHSLVAGGELRGPLASGRQWFADLDARYLSKRYTSFENSLYMDAYWLADARFGVKSDRWSVTGYVNNLFNDDTLKASAVYIQNWSLAYNVSTGRTPVSVQAPSGARAVLPDKRQIGVRVSYDFGK